MVDVHPSGPHRTFPSIIGSYWSPWVWRFLHSPAWLPGQEGFKAGLSWPLLHMAWLLPALQLERQTNRPWEKPEGAESKASSSPCREIPPAPIHRATLSHPMDYKHVTKASLDSRGDQTPGPGSPITEAHGGYGCLGSKPHQGSVCKSGGALQL